MKGASQSYWEHQNKTGEPNLLGGPALQGRAMFLEGIIHEGRAKRTEGTI